MLSWDKDFETAFNPRSIAVVGASRDVDSRGQRFGRGTQFILRLQHMGYPGKIYPINPRADEIVGLKTYPSVSAIPGPVDLVMVAVPAPVVPRVLLDCAQAGARNVHIYTAGFRETGLVEGQRLEEQVREIARVHGLRVMGPNCMGMVFIPRSRVATMEPATPDEPGPVAFLSQSGGHSGRYTSLARGTGLKFSKVISFGNGAVMDSTDFLEYLKDDPETGVIDMYLEGVKDGRKFFSLVKEINPVKPIVLWKGGTSNASARIAASHTGSLAGNQQIWDALCQQTGVTRVNGLEEMADITETFVYMKAVPEGRRIAAIGVGGGTSVVTTDMCAREGIEMPTLSQDTINELAEFIPAAGSILVNPLDVWAVFQDLDLLQRTLEIVSREPVIDMIILTVPLEDISRLEDAEPLERFSSLLISFARSSQKPLGLIPFSRTFDPEINEGQRKLTVDLLRAGVMVYGDFARAARALSKFADYHLFMKEREGNAKATPTIN